MVFGREAERVALLCGPALGYESQQRCDHLGRRRARHKPHGHLCGAARTSVPNCERDAGVGCPQGRHGGGVHAHGARAVLRDAGLRAHWRRALGCVCGLQCGSPTGPHRVREEQVVREEAATSTVIIGALQ